MKNKILIVWAIVIVTVSIILLNSYSSGLNLQTASSRVKIDKYSSLEELIRKEGIDIPLALLKEPGDVLDVENVMHQIITIHTSKYVLKMAPYIQVEADPLGLYSKNCKEEINSLKESDIDYIRIRREYEEYENCTIVNWSKRGIQYGLIYGDILDNGRVYELIGIDESKLIEYIPDEAEETEEEQVVIPTSIDDLSEEERIEIEEQIRKDKEQQEKEATEATTEETTEEADADN